MFRSTLLAVMCLGFAALAGSSACGLSRGSSEIYVMNADGTDPANLTNDPAPDDQPAFSPDGTKIAFTSRHREVT